MRDNNEGMPELLAAFERQGQYSALVETCVGGRSYRLELGIDESSYHSLRHLLTLRPFLDTSHGPYRYFYSGTYETHDRKSTAAAHA